MSIAYVLVDYVASGYVGLSVDVTVSAGAGSLSLSGQVATVSATSGGVDVALTADAGSLSLAGLAPSLAHGHTLQVGVGAVALAGLAPTVDATTVIHSNVTVGAGAIALAGQQVSLKADAKPAVGADALALAGLAPSLELGWISTVGAGALALSGQAPTVLATDGSVGVNVTAGLGAITLAGQAVSVVAEAPTGGSIALYNTAKMYLFDGTLDLDTDAIAVVLLGPGYTPSASHDTWSDISGQEAGGYTQQALGSKALSVAGAITSWDGADVTFGPSITATAKYVALVQGTAGSLVAGDKLIGWSQLRSDGVIATVLNSSLDVHWSGSGIWRAN